MKAFVIVILFGAASVMSQPEASQKHTHSDSAMVETEIGRILDPATGNINGKVALAIYPAHYEGRHGKEILDVPDCKVHLVAVNDLDDEILYPCSSWFSPPAGYYRYWLESAGRITPFSKKMRYSSPVFKTQGSITGMPLPLESAGRVTFPDSVKRSPLSQLRLLHAGIHSSGGVLNQEVSRRIRADRADGGVQMPIGPTLAALWDTGAGQYRMLSRLFTTHHGETVVAPLEHPPTERAHVLIQVIRHRPKPALEEAAIDIVLIQKEEKKKPDEKVVLADNAYAVWYDVPPGKVEIWANTANEGKEPLELELRAGAITHGRIQLSTAWQVDLGKR